MSLSHVHSHPFKFYYTRGSASAVEFHPHAGTKLAYQNRGVDTLKVVHPSAELEGGDKIKVTYNGATVFQGTVEQITESESGGSDCSQEVLVSSPWSKLDRLVYQQKWGTSDWSSNLFLNQDKNGNAIGFKTQLNDIFSFAAGRCGISAQTLSGGQTLPTDEVRDLTCAQAINRVLRWFPKQTVRLGYAGNVPNIELVAPSSAAWTSGIDKTSVVRTYNAHPITAVWLETVTTGTNDGAEYRLIGHQAYPANADPTGVDVLHATVMLAGADASSSYETFSTHCDSEIAPSNQGWWKKYHPRLKNVSVNDITMVNWGTRENAGDYPRKADCSVEELTRFGLKARVETFTAQVKVREHDGDDEEENLVLQMKFVTTNAVDGKVYRRMVGSSSTTSETIPSGLAQAIYEDRSGSLKTLECTARLGSAFPKIGETYEGLILQSFEVDPADLTFSCRFGQPDHLSPDDMAGLMTGFRNRTRTTSGWNREEGEKEDGGDTPEIIAPIEATEFAPGIKTKTAFRKADGTGSKISLDSSGNGGDVEIKTSEVDSGNKISVHTVTKTDGDEETEVQFLGSDDLEFTTLSIAGGAGINVAKSGNVITISNTKPCNCSGGGEGGSDSGFTGKVNLVDSMRYDKASKRLQVQIAQLEYEDGLCTNCETRNVWEDIEGGQAVEETVGNG